MRQFTPEDKVSSARLDLCTNFPYYGSVFYRLNVFEDNTCSTAWTDGVSIGYNLEYTAKLSHEQIIGLFVHECKHVMLKHHVRMVQNPDFKAKPRKWNYACDYALNPTIKRTPGMDIHENWLYDKKWDDALADEIFYQLKDSDIKDGKPGEPGNGDGIGEPGPIGEVRPMPKTDKDGKPIDGQPTAAEVDAEIQKVDQWVKAAAFKAQGAGKLDGHVTQSIKADTATTVSWQDELIFLCDELCKNDYTWTRPNIRYVAHGLYLPTLHGRKTVDMVFFVDCSGSVDDEQLAQIATEIQTIVGTYNIRVVVIYWDTKYRDMEVFDAHDVVDPEFRLNIHGRGGTNFGGCWDWLDENMMDFDIDPKAMVFFSDLECSSYPRESPDMPVIWAQVPYDGSFQHSYIQYLPDYGKHVKVPVYRQQT
jgi:predicted metal-dependent peptidase